MTSKFQGSMVPNYKNIQLSCRLHAHPPWQFCKWCQPELYLHFNPLTHVNPASIVRQQRLAPAVSYPEKARSSAWVFNSRVNRTNHADSWPQKNGKAEQFLVLISFWISSCGLYSPAWPMRNLFNWIQPLSSLVALFFLIVKSEARVVWTFSSWLDVSFGSYIYYLFNRI